MVHRLAVFLDYENALRTGRDVFRPGAAPWTVAPDPVRLSQRIMRTRPDDPPVELARVNVYRGRPDPRKERLSASTSDRQKANWERDDRVRVTRRPLTYRQWPDHPPVEKGIDVKLAVDLIHAAIQGNYDVLIIFSSDTDLVPAVELASETGAHVETATWLGANLLPCQKGCHLLSREDWLAAIRDWS
jgi:hypothetical protein